MHRIVLGSASPYRRHLMASLGLEFEVQSPLLDEEKEKRTLESQGAAPLQMAQTLARLKAESLRAENRLIIGGDQLVHLNGTILGKPHTKERALEQLLSMQNKTHEIITAVCLSTPLKNYEFYDIARLTMKPFFREDLVQYIELDQPLDCAGSYKIEKNGHGLFSLIEAQDLTAIQGLPLISLANWLQSLGYDTKKTTK